MIQIELTESERQMMLLAMAVLSLESPGFKNSLEETAAKFDQGSLFNDFRLYRSNEPCRRSGCPGKKSESGGPGYS